MNLFHDIYSCIQPVKSYVKASSSIKVSKVEKVKVLYLFNGIVGGFHGIEVWCKFLSSLFVSGICMYLYV